MNNNRIAMVSAIEDNYAQHLGVMVTSIFENKGNEEIVYYVVDGGISNKNKNKLKKISIKYNFEIIFIKASKQKIINLKLNKHFSFSNYLVLLIPQLIKEDRIIYLDSDMIIFDTLIDLWKTNLGSYIVAATIDGGSESKKTALNLGLDEKEYFNSGLLLIDLIKWRNKDVTERTINFIKNNPEKIENVDQDGLNHILRGKWLKVDKKYNYTKIIYPNLRFNNKNNYENKPVAIHYVGYQSKPWLFTTNYSKKYYRKYLFKTPWRFNLYTDLNKITPTKIYKKYKELFLIAINQQSELFDFLKKIKNMIR